MEILGKYTGQRLNDKAGKLIFVVIVLQVITKYTKEWI